MIHIYHLNISNSHIEKKLVSGKALVGQAELCLLTDQQTSSWPHSQPGCLKPEGREAMGRAQGAQHAGGGHWAAWLLPESFLQHSEYYYFANFRWGEGLARAQEHSLVRLLQPYGL